MDHHSFSMTPRARRGGAAPTAAAMLLGTGLACCGSAWANAAPRADGLDVGLAHSAPASASWQPPLMAASDAAAVGASRSLMAGWTPVAESRLDALRGGFEAAGLQVSFGIERAVYINGDLVVSTSLTIPDVSRITAEQAGRLAAALQGAANAGATAAAAVNAALGSNGATTSHPGSPGASSSTAGTGSASATASAGQPGTGSATPGTASAGATASVPPPAVIATATGTVATNGLLNLIQNGPGNRFDPATLASSPATVIQNTLSNQSIQSLLTIDASVNTLQAFRAQVAGSALQNALLRAASAR
jgi:hypothetical protein